MDVPTEFGDDLTGTTGNDTIDALGGGRYGPRR